MVILHRDKGWLHEARCWCAEYLHAEGLQLHPNKCHVMPIRNGINYLGYLIWPHYRRLRNDNGHRFARKLRLMQRQYREYRIDWDDIDARVQSWSGHARHAQTEGLRQSLFADIVFQRGESA